MTRALKLASEKFLPPSVALTDPEFRRATDPERCYSYRMRSLPKGIDAADLPDLAHYRGHGIDRIKAWCLTQLCHHQASLTFDQLQAYGARDSTKLWDIGQRLRCTACGRQNADVQPDWSQTSRAPERAST